MSLAAYGVQDKQLTRGQQWGSFVVLFAIAFVSAFNMFKAAPCISFIGSDLGFTPDGLGLIMSSYTLAIIIFAYPGMAIMRKVGVKASLVLACLFMIVGSLIVYLSTGMASFLVGRFVEGIAYGFICCIGAAIIPRIFPRKKLGFAMGVFSQYLGVGTAISFFVAPVIFEATGWRTLWLASVAVEILALVLAVVLMKMPQTGENELIAAESSENKKADGNRNYIIVAVATIASFMAWVFVFGDIFNTFYPTYLQDVKGQSMFMSSLLPNITGIIAIPLGIVAGWFVGKYQNCKGTIIVANAISAVIFLFAFTEGEGMVAPWVFCLLLSIPASCMAVCVRTLITIAVEDVKKCDWMLATLSFFIGIGQTLSFLASMSIANLGWSLTGLYVCVPLFVVATIIPIFFIVSEKKMAASRAETSE